MAWKRGGIGGMLLGALSVWPGMVAAAEDALGPSQPELERRLEKWPPQLVIDTGGHQSPVADLMFAPDGKTLYTVSQDKTIQIWDVASGKRRRVFRLQRGPGEQGKLYSGAISPDGEQLAVGCWDHAIRILDAQSGEVEQVLRGHQGIVHALDFSPNGRYLLSGSMDEIAYYWDLDSGQPFHSFGPHGAGVRSVMVGPHGYRLATSPYDPRASAYIWDAKSGEEVRDLSKSRYFEATYSLSFSPDGKYLVTNGSTPGQEDAGFAIWASKTGKFVGLVKTVDDTLESNSTSGFSTISPDGERLIISNYYLEKVGGKVSHYPFWYEEYTFPEGRLLETYETPPKRVIDHRSGFVWNKAKNIVGTAGPFNSKNDIIVQIWAPEKDKVYNRLSGVGSGVISAVGFSEKGGAIGWARKHADSFDRFSKEHTLQNRFFLPLPKNPTGSRNAVVSQSGWQRGIQGVGNTEIRVQPDPDDGHPNHWKLEILRYGQVVRRINRKGKASSTHSALTLTPDGNTVISGGRNGYLASYDAHTGEKLHEYIGHSEYITSVAPSPDGRLLVSGSSDQTIRLWEIATGELLV
ncbi:WD40 repeat domain-containing protein, partial [Thiohalorhabdus methylotrophus]